MPYKSLAQEKFFNANVGKRRGITPAVVAEFDAASKGMTLPTRVAKKAKKKR